MRSIAAAAVLIAIANVASRVLGLGREAVMAWLFGATGATDAFVIASAVPQIVYDLLIGGAITAALVPVFVDAEGDDERLWRLLGAVLTLAALLLGGVALGLGVLAPLVVALLGFGFDAERQAEAVPMVRVMLGAVVLQGLAGVVMAMLYARRRFGPPAFAAAVYNGGIIVGALALHQALGVYALVLGVVLGAAGQLALQLVGLGRARLRPTLDLVQPEVRRVLRLYAPVALGMVVTIVGIAIDRALASGLAEGSLSVMSYATRLVQFPLGLVGTAIAFAVLPTLSKHATALTTAEGEASESDRRGYRETLLFGVRIVLLLMVPATVGLVLLREPLVQLLFERGRFGQPETARTAEVFLAYAPQLPFTALDQLLIVAFYARKDTRTPVVVGVGGVLVYLVAALATIGSLGAAGLALANAIQNSVHGLVLLALLERSGLGLVDAALGWFAARVVLAASGMGIAVWAVPALVGPADGTVGTLLVLGVAGLLGAAVYGVLLELFGVRDARTVWDVARERLGRRPTG
jgi:putative peptidoglycan lipid II flippase